MTFPRRLACGGFTWLFAGLVSAGVAASAGRPLFEEVSAQTSGILWAHDNLMTPERYLPETVGAGCAFLDFDADGWMDIYFVNSGRSDLHDPSRPPRNALYRNNRDGTFSDVTEQAGVVGGNFGMGVAVGDFDNDGLPDMFVTGYGRSLLYRNRGDGGFEEVAERAGVTAPGWSTSAAWLDYDDDGRVDLFVCGFVEYGRAAGKPVCADNQLGRAYYCIPRVFKPRPSLLYRNNGDGTFSEVGKGTEIERALGKALGVVATDVNNDRRMDLFVANDTVQNFLFVNRGKGVWEEIALPAEVGYGANGQPRSGMGVDAADVDGDGWQDLFVANIDQELFSLYLNNKDESFTDAAHAHGIAQATRLLSGWGLKFFDWDNDGHVDLIQANGHPDDMIDQYGGQVRYREPLLLFRHDGTRLRDVSAEAGPAFAKTFAARGLAVGDAHNDGRLDVLVSNNGGPPLLLRNTAGQGNHWVGVRLQGTGRNRDAIGALLTWSVGGMKRSRLKTSGGSYLSSHDPREVLGLGQSTSLDWLEVQWPGPQGRTERFEKLPLDRYTTIVEGQGRALPPEAQP